MHPSTHPSMNLSTWLSICPSIYLCTFTWVHMLLAWFQCFHICGLPRLCNSILVYQNTHILKRTACLHTYVYRYSHEHAYPDKCMHVYIHVYPFALCMGDCLSDFICFCIYICANVHEHMRVYVYKSMYIRMRLGRGSDVDMDCELLSVAPKKILVRLILRLLGLDFGWGL